jgi:N-acetylneuraminic acid mutarotase
VNIPPDMSYSFGTYTHFAFIHHPPDGVVFMKTIATFFLFCLTLMLCSPGGSFAQNPHADNQGPFFPMPASSLGKSGPADIMGQWSSRADLPAAMGYNTAVYYDGAIYNFSGLTSSALLTTVYKLDLASNTWEQVATLPRARALAASVVIDDKIYVIGGYSSGSPFTTEGTILEFHPSNNRFEEKARMPLPVFAAGCFVHEGRIWVLGGGTTGFQAQTDAIQIYDPATDTWTQSTSKLPRSLRSFSAVNIKGTAYFIGGYAVVGTQGQFFGYMYKGEISNDDIVWTQLADFPGGAIMRYSMGTDGNLLYLTGGYNILTQQTGAMANQTWAYNPLVNAWRGEVLKPTPVSYGSNFLYDGGSLLYQVGGQTTGNAYVPAVEAYDFSAESKPSAIISATGLSFWAKRSSTYNNAFNIGNTGGEDLIWSAAVESGASSWLEITSQSTGNINPGGQFLLVYRVTPASLTEGVHVGRIEVTTNDSENPSLEYTVRITVQELDVDEPSRVLIEQYTGTWCQWCPYGADSLAAVSERLGDRVVRTSWHDRDAMQISEWSTMSGFIGIPGFPTASINRIRWPGATAIPVSRGDWGNYASFVVNNLRAPVGVDVIDKTYDPATRNLSMKVKVFFHQGIDADLRLNVLITEDGLNYEQVKWTQTGNIRVFPYYHQAVVKAIYPSVQGMPLSTTNTFTSQSEIIKEFSVTLPQSMDDSTHIIAYVHRLNGENPGPVQQSYTEPLLRGLTNIHTAPAAADFVLHQNYPNPFNPTTTITFTTPRQSNVTIRLSDALGRSLGDIVSGNYEAGAHSIVFDGSELTSGNYFMTLISEDVVLTRSMTLLK